MRYSLLIILAIGMVFYGCKGGKSKVPANVVNIPNSASGDDDKNSLPVIEFATKDHDFGKVIQGEVVSFSFKFKNTGKSDLVIANISTSCGCTASEYPRKPVKPGEEDVIEVSFDSSGREGFQHKTLEVATNSQPSTTVLAIMAMVFRPEKE
jgi:hypothetical protein